MTTSCRHCGYENPAAADHCGQCLRSLMQRDIPSARRRGDAFQDALLNEPVSELLTGVDLLVCSPEDSVKKVLAIFQKEKKSCVLVYENKKMVGLFSQRDLVMRVVGVHKDLSKIRVGEVMTRNPGFVHPEDPLAFAIHKMALGGDRQVPVLRPDGTPVSVLLIRDVLRYLSVSKKIY